MSPVLQGVFIRMALFTLAFSPHHPICTPFLTPPHQLREKSMCCQLLAFQIITDFCLFLN